jgi:hypothetical protein
MGIGEAEAFSERLKRELQALEAANVHAILESEPLVDEVIPFLLIIILWIILVLDSSWEDKCLIFLYIYLHAFQVLNGLEAATNIVDDMDEWLGIFNIKLRHMREDIESVGLLTYK